jgi:hypothetical protein
MAIKYPIEYTLKPRSIDAGRQWMTLRIKNIGANDLTALDVRLNSLDAYSLSVFGTGSYISLLRPNEEREIPFQVSANQSANLYVTLDGRENGQRFHWESPGLPITVGKEAAELVSVFAMTEPYSYIGERIKCEATVRGLGYSEGLTIEFWVDTPGDRFEELAVVETKALSAGEEATYSAEITPDEEGLYTVYAYLYDGVRRIGRQVEHVYVREA